MEDKHDTHHWHCFVLLALGGLMLVMAALMTMSVFFCESKCSLLASIIAGYLAAPGIMLLASRNRAGCAHAVGLWGITCSTISIWVVILDLVLMMFNGKA